MYPNSINLEGLDHGAYVVRSKPLDEFLPLNLRRSDITLIKIIFTIRNVDHNKD